MVVATKYVMGVFFHLNPQPRIGLLNRRCKRLLGCIHSPKRNSFNSVTDINQLTKCNLLCAENAVKPQPIKNLELDSVKGTQQSVVGFCLR